MKTLIETTLFRMFTSYSTKEELIPSELTAAYEQFASLLSDIPVETERVKHLRRLNYTKIELLSLKEICDTMQDRKHVLYDVFINKSLALLDAEIGIIKDFYREDHVLGLQTTLLKMGEKGKKNTTLTWNGTDSDLIELVAALMASGVIGSTTGVKVTIVDVVNVFEKAFHIKINALYTKRGKVFDRCTDTTPFIDSLRNSYNRMLQDRLA